MKYYRERDQILRRVGFTSYKDYLQSDLWKKIRSKKLKSDPDCFACQKTATQVHHGKYTLSNLLGYDQESLFSVCGGCHKFIEFNKNGGKIGIRRATKKLKASRRYNIKTIETMEALDAEYKARLEREP